ncbi:hypothetical protein PGT21_022623 [Puccinia graminis f. sp. tritici]|uniref:Uncharacterized protein n=1 Tax=Puccinia graminis f. sp. tritici TaxID=56615 RepID=A0A5B0M907_PUCGR|nr:hypothetical protein PGT21_022623 [Puccinia graminis f. sp. tritici]KAA1132808.1 hypothetical protein PGTUg99_017518 [Puccinia graminis f. sp. tritici]
MTPRGEPSSSIASSSTRNLLPRPLTSTWKLSPAGTEAAEDHEDDPQGREDDDDSHFVKLTRRESGSSGLELK